MNGDGALPRLPLLEARALEFQYPGGFRLGPLDLRLHSGELACLMGEPGAGKSTLLRILAARLPLGAGSLLFRQEPLVDAHPAGLAAWRRRLGILEQGGLPDGRRSTRELMTLALAVRGLGPRARRRESTRILGELGLLARADLPCAGLSTGQTRWAQLALALCGLPDLLLLDEPLAHLSPEHQADFMTALRRVAARGAAVLFCRHGDPARAEEGVRRLLLAGGRLTEIDPAPGWRPR